MERGREATANETRGAAGTQCIINRRLGGVNLGAATRAPCEGGPDRGAAPRRLLRSMIG